MNSRAGPSAQRGQYDPSIAEHLICDEHGPAYEAFVCRHLLGASDLGFEQSEDVPDQARPDAWCGDCERYRVENDGWSDDVPPPVGIAVVCHHCYDKIRAANELPRFANPFLAGRVPP